jgi:hypothetical protein
VAVFIFNSFTPHFTYAQKKNADLADQNAKLTQENAFLAHLNAKLTQQMAELITSKSPVTSEKKRLPPEMPLRAEKMNEDIIDAAFTGNISRLDINAIPNFTILLQVPDFPLTKMPNL